MINIAKELVNYNSRNDWRRPNVLVQSPRMREDNRNGEKPEPSLLPISSWREKKQIYHRVPETITDH
jgi:hypothetical protein